MLEIDFSASDWIAVAALAISLSHLAGSVIVRIIRGRKASFEVSAQMVPVPKGLEGFEEQVVIRNHGPALATDVEVALFGPEGQGFDTPFIRGSQIKRVWPNQTLHLPVNLTLASPPVAEVQVSWTDRRRGSHSESFEVAAHWTT